MPNPTARRVLLALILIVSPFVATASEGPVEAEIPTDANILITDGRGVIVGVGEAHEGTTFRLALVEGFSGAATLIFVLDDGSFQEIEVVIDEGGVSIGDRRLTDLVASRFADVAIGRETPGSTPLGEASGPDATGDEGSVDEGSVDDGTVAVPPIEAGPPEGDDRRGPAANEPPSGEPRRAEPPADTSSAEEPPVAAPPSGPPAADEAPDDTRDDTRDDTPSDEPGDTPDRGRP